MSTLAIPAMMSNVHSNVDTSGRLCPKAILAQVRSLYREREENAQSGKCKVAAHMVSLSLTTWGFVYTLFIIYVQVCFHRAVL